MKYPTVQLNVFDNWIRYRHRDVATFDYWGGTVTDLNNLNLLFNRDLPILVDKGIVSKKSKLYTDSHKFYDYDIAEVVDGTDFEQAQKFTLLDKILNQDLTHFFNRQRLLGLYKAEIANK